MLTTTLVIISLHSCFIDSSAQSSSDMLVIFAFWPPLCKTQVPTLPPKTTSTKSSGTFSTAPHNWSCSLCPTVGTHPSLHSPPAPPFSTDFSHSVLSTASRYCGFAVPAVTALRFVTILLLQFSKYSQHATN